MVGEGGAVLRVAHCKISIIKAQLFCMECHQQQVLRGEEGRNPY